MGDYYTCICQEKLDSYRQKNYPEDFFQYLKTTGTKYLFEDSGKPQDKINNYHIENESNKDVNRLIFSLERENCGYRAGTGNQREGNGKYRPSYKGIVLKKLNSKNHLHRNKKDYK